MQEPWKKPEIPLYITGQKYKEEMSPITTDLEPVSKPEDKYEKPSDAKKDIQQPEVSQKKAKVSSGPKPEKEEIKPSKQEIISIKKQQVEITTKPKTDVKQHVVLEKNELVTTKEDVSQELTVVAMAKPKAKKGLLHNKEFVFTSEKETVPQEHKVEPDKREFVPPKKQEFVLTGEEKGVFQELNVASLSKIDERTGILHEKECILISEEIVPVESQGDHGTPLTKKEGIRYKKEGFILTSAEEPLPQEPATKIETEQKGVLHKKELHLFSEEETKPCEVKVIPLPMIEKRERAPLKRKEMSLTLAEEMVPQELKVEPVPETAKNESIPLAKKEFVSISEEKALSQEPKLAPALKLDEQGGVLHTKEFSLISEEETKPQKLKRTPVSKTKEKDKISSKKTELVLTSEDKLSSQKMKETPAPKVKAKEGIPREKQIEFAITSEEEESANQQLIATREPERKEKEQAQLMKKADLTSKEAALAPHEHHITPKKGEGVSEKTDIITTLPERPASKKMEVVSSEKEPHLQTPEVKPKVEEDVPHAQKSTSSLQKKELVAHKKGDTLIPVKDDSGALQKGVIASKGTNGKSRHIFLIFTLFLKTNSSHLTLNCSTSRCLTCTYS